MRALQNTKPLFMFTLIISICPVASSDQHRKKQTMGEPLQLTGKAPESKQIKEMTNKAVTFLLHSQKDEGWWVSSNRADTMYIVTALCLRAILTYRSVDPQRIDKALLKGFNWLREPATRITQETVKIGVLSDLSHALVVELMLDLIKNKCPVPIEDATKMLKKHLAVLAKERWHYFSCDAIVEAFVIQSLLRAKQHGMEVDEKLLQDGVCMINGMEISPGYFAYSRSDNRDKRDQLLKELSTTEKIQEGIGRIGACVLSKYLLRQCKIEVLEGAIATFFKYRHALDKARLQQNIHNPHIQELFGVAPYYFFIGHYFAAKALLHVGKETSGKYGPYFHEILHKIQDKDGSWMDYHEVGPAYGTAMGLLILAELDGAREK